MKSVNGNYFQCDIKKFCKQIEKQNNFIIGIVMAHSARDFISREFETILEKKKVFRPFSRNVNKTNLLS